MKKKFKILISFLKSAKYELLMACEIIALISAIIYCAFGRNKQFSFLTAVSALIGAYISATAIYKVNSTLNARKYIDIISAMKNANSEEIE